jgi:hypothetical protein
LWECKSLNLNYGIAISAAASTAASYSDDFSLCSRIVLENYLKVGMPHGGFPFGKDSISSLAESPDSLARHGHRYL